ncbi:MAG: CHAT domain-containing protein [Thiofilum sp.]|uniref:CHAT domain-containing protein n=1 Tax=Thiofilum sp. TaxID=2212733 RepID=UPI0025E2B270|nr:CHAT domain-containing protein [Thiofilum sp.]MBK8455263.1 CHAT domain-containing protein [Thiofilum sp.]
MNCKKSSQIIALFYLGLYFLLGANVFANDCDFISDKPIKGVFNREVLSCLSNMSDKSYENLVNLVANNDNDSYFSNETNRQEVFNSLIERALQKRTSNKIYERSLLQLLERQRLYKLQGYFDDDCIPLTNDGISLDTSVGVLYTHSLDNNRFLIMLLKNNAILKISIINKQRILESVGSFRQKLTSETIKNSVETDEHSAYKELKSISYRLYNLIMQPFQEELSKLSHLVVVPDASIGIIPIEALWDGKEYVLNKNYTISYAPNLSKFYKKTYKGKKVLFISPEDISLAEAGDSGFNQDLVLLRQEKLKVNSLLGHKTSKIEVLRELSSNSVGIIHIAAHALFMPDFNESYVQLYNTGKDFSNGKVYVKDFEKMMVSSSARRLSPDLIVLGACETATGGNNTVDATLGLAGVAARSGVNSVIASLWLLNIPEVLLGPKGGKTDNSLGDHYTEYFYHIITTEPHITKAKALQRSKRGIQKNRSIYEWAALVLIGEWGSF